MRYLLMLSLLLPALPVWAAAPRAGVARVDITPEESIWMSGYAARKRPSTGVQMPIQAKALALDDGRGGLVVLVAIDIIGLPAALSDRVAAEAAKLYKLDRAQIVLNASHTHTGPMVEANLMPMAPADNAELKKIRAYTNTLAGKLVTVIGAALGDLSPARFDFDYGEAGFAINRRKLEIAPVDHRVPVLRVTAPNGQIRALLFGYACHNTTLTAEFLEISGDYAGYAQAQLEKEFPGATALFFMLCGGDQNPEPRSRRELAEKHGGELAREVARLARTKMQPVEGRLRTAFQLTRLALNNMKQVNYPVQAVRFEKGFTLIALGGEVVVDYALKFTNQYPGERLMVAGYSNDVMCYIPSLRILREGGYEGGDSMKWYGLDAPFAEDVEERVTDTVAAVLQRVRK
ncbi:MAG: neutral/alkaline non-lysosomal ceramidase N-terminal domain-containing protein [Bryobacteraceae bacterium]|nr:neutral/alkaline non-lysosomal ceramidase N-terminal domain-containing protein [Bryobacteraceae bacterium]